MLHDGGVGLHVTAPVHANHLRYAFALLDGTDMGLQQLTTGVDAVDALIDGARIGDNVVVVTRAGVPAGWLVDHFLAAADHDRLVIADASGRHAGHEAVQVLDWSGGDNGDVTAEQARAQLADADRRVGSDALFAVDSLSELAAAWGDQAALDLFLWACPRLFRRGSIALWLVDRDRHDEAFIARLTDITQVVVNLSPAADDGVRLEVVKADGRSPTVVGRTIQARLQDGQLVDVGSVVADRRRFGDMLRDLRVSRGVGQADLARRIGISPSALSQAERGVRGVSAETLLRVFDALGTPLTDALQLQGYRVNRRSTQTSTPLASGVTGRRLADQGVTVWQLTVAPRAASRQPLFPVKAVEVVTVLRGVLELEVGGRRQTLHEGDSLEAGEAAITAWSNPADTPSEAIWVIGT